ncbi:MAG TPA: HPF/RaiA family ribosome-associated protein [Steroidobacteraceae bacterium]|jgi:ribosomal subunit interface protein
MLIPLQITFRNMDPSPALESRARELATRLEKFSASITRCHVVIETPHRHQHKGELFEVRIDVTVPEKEIAIRRTRPADPAHQDAYVALRDAFRAARRQLEKYTRERRREVKTHAEPPRGRICELDPQRNFGRIEADDGRLIYFHRNSVLGSRFEDLATGMEVRFAEEAGELGPQATTVHVLRRRHHEHSPHEQDGLERPAHTIPGVLP